jgi:hypothetical protein
MTRLPMDMGLQAEGSRTGKEGERRKPMILGIPWKQGQRQLSLKSATLRFWIEVSLPLTESG